MNGVPEDAASRYASRTAVYRICGPFMRKDDSWDAETEIEDFLKMSGENKLARMCAVCILDVYSCIKYFDRTADGSTERCLYSLPRLLFALFIFYSLLMPYTYKDIVL